VGFIGVFLLSSDDDIRNLVETFTLTFPVGRETGIAEQLGVRGLPVTVFLDRSGKVTKRHIGVITYEQLVTSIEPMLK